MLFLKIFQYFIFTKVVMTIPIMDLINDKSTLESITIMLKVFLNLYNNANKSDHRLFIAEKSLSAWQHKLLDDDNFESRWLGNDGEII